MKIAVLVPSDEYKSYAGARIRYARIAPHLKSNGVELSVENIGQFDPEASDADVVLISKCHDAQSLVVAASAAGRGKLVGVDLFDDYFSQKFDARLIAYRNWLTQLIEVCDFAVCSTEVMERVIHEYRANLPVHVLNDPAPSHDSGFVSKQVERKLKDARDGHRLKAVWFGVGDNPYFPVGLSDVAAYGNVLGQLTRSGMAVELRILTNRRSLTAHGLSMIRQLPIAHRVEEWTEEGESQALAEAMLAFLPVNAQAFSAAKSLNRAFTALSNGCQVLSVGYPLYEALDALIYRDVDSFLQDLELGSFRLSAKTAGLYDEVQMNRAHDRGEAERLAHFLAGFEVKSPENSLPISLVHGLSTRVEAHRLAQVARGYSVASPFCTAPFDFDVVFRGSPFALEMLVSRDAWRRLSPRVQAMSKSREQIRGRHFYRVLGKQSVAPKGGEDAIPYQIATYARTMSEIEDRMIAAFGPCRTIVSETSALPLPISKAS